MDVMLAECAWYTRRGCNRGIDRTCYERSTPERSSWGIERMTYDLSVMCSNYLDELKFSYFSLELSLEVLELRTILSAVVRTELVASPLRYTGLSFFVKFAYLNRGSSSSVSSSS